MRKLILTIVVLCLAVVPAAFAASGASSPAPSRPLVNAALFSNPVAAPAARSAVREATARARRARRVRRGAPASVPRTAVAPQLQAIAACESGGNPRAIGGGGLYRGKYQFNTSTWASVGGSGDPAAAPESEQDRRAAMLYARSGAGQWPVCGR